MALRAAGGQVMVVSTPMGRLVLPRLRSRRGTGPSTSERTSPIRIGPGCQYPRSRARRGAAASTINHKLRRNPDPTSGAQRGHLWLLAAGATRAGEPARHRPAVVVCVGEILTGIDDEPIVAVPASSSPAHNPSRPHTSGTEGADTESVAGCRGIRAVARPRPTEATGHPGAGHHAPNRTRERALAPIPGIQIA
jgi:mRNA interferase MazF